MATIYGTSSGGKKYTIGSQKGQDFVNNAKPGSTLTGADGSTWTKNQDGSTTIVQNGQKYTVGGSTASSGGGSSSSGGGSSSSGGGSSSSSRPYATDDYGQTDYSVLIQDAINAGAGWQTVQDLLDKRTQKAQQNGYNQYMYDDVYQKANQYIQNNQNSLYNQYLDQMNQQYNDIAAQQQAAQQAAVEQAVNQLSSQKAGIAQSYEDLYRQLYLDRRRAEKNLPQQLAAMGISGGLTESTALGLQTDYTDALRQGEQEKLSTLSDIDSAIADARLSGDIGIAQQAAQLAMDRLANYGDVISAMQNQQNYYNSLAQQQQQNAIANSQWQQEFSRQQMLDQLNRQDISYDRKLQIAQYLYETTGDPSGFRSLGFTDAQIAALQNSYAAAMGLSTAGGSGGSGSGGSSGSYRAASAGTGPVTAGSPPAADSGEGSVLSPAAQSILNSYRHVNPGTTANVSQLFADRIESALASGAITQADVNYLLTILGV